MKSARTGAWPAHARRVQEEFERWRAGKRGPGRIPARLWEAAVKLCETQSVHRVSRRLRLNHTVLQRRAGRRLVRRPGSAKPAFVEWSLPAGVLPQAWSAEYVVEVSAKKDGAQRIHVRGASVSEVAALARALRAQAGRG